VTTTDFEADEARWSRYMAAAHRGDSRSYEALFGEIAVAIERYVRRRFGSLGPFSEDCVQECLLAIHLGRHTYDPARPFRPWLFAIVRNKTIDLLRRSYAVSWRETAEAGRATVFGFNADPADELAAGEWLLQLEPNHRAALELTKLRGYSTAEAAAEIGISETAMRTRVSRALRATVELLRKEYYE
jgi:RNA polymerase sigma-70 factor (ECF subfamily)